MKLRKKFFKNPFYNSLLFGISIWVLAYILLPVKITDDIHVKTILYVFSSYFFLILGFNLFKFSRLASTHTGVNPNIGVLLKILLITILFSYILRWIDLFIIRDLSLSYLPKVNRSLNYDNSLRSNLIFNIASVIKSIYFFPFVIVTIMKKKINNYITIASYCMLLLPLVEALLFGTRKIFVEIFLIVIITLLVSNKLIFNFKQILLIFITSLMLLSISIYILINREATTNSGEDSFYTQILSSRYNEKVPPKENVINFLENSENPKILQYYSLSILQIGQYFLHGLFEFNHIILMDKPELSLGKHTFYPIVKLYNGLGIFENVELKNYTPRGYVYITFFGGIYLDFRWLGLLFFLCFGITQKYIYQKSKINIIYRPLLIYLLMINVFLLSFNFLRGSGIYPVFGFIIFFTLFQIFQYIKNEKSFNT